MNTPALDGIPAIVLFAGFTLLTFGPFLLFYFAWSAHRSLRRIAEAAEYMATQSATQPRPLPHAENETLEQARERIARTALAS